MAKEQEHRLLKHQVVWLCCHYLKLFTSIPLTSIVLHASKCRVLTNKKTEPEHIMVAVLLDRTQNHALVTK